eukprot:2056824-Amphidinium_carterae.1
MWRDIFDEVVGRYWEYFGQLRDLCEQGASDALPAEAVGGGAVFIRVSNLMKYVAYTCIHKHAHLTACAKLGIHPDDDVEGAVAEL